MVICTNYRKISAVLLFCTFILYSASGVSGDEISETAHPGIITFTLTDLGDTAITSVSLMKAGEYFKDGRTNQDQNLSFNRNTNEISWNPCNDNDCSYASFPTSGGNNGRDELILKISLIDPTVDVSSCRADPTCERLRGATSTKSGMLDGIFKTGRSYELSVASLKAGIGQQYVVTEKED